MVCEYELFIRGDPYFCLLASKETSRPYSSWEVLTLGFIPLVAYGCHGYYPFHYVSSPTFHSFPFSPG